MNLKVRLDNDDHYVGGNTKQYLVIHDTGNTTDSDEANANYFCTGSRGASAHYFVDSDSITQVVKDDDCSWHCGDGYGKYGITNRNSIGIELCRVNNKVEYQTKLNAIELIKLLMSKYNIPFDRVVRHYDASRKCCPSSMSANNWAEWYEFKNMISGNITNNTAAATGEIYRVRKSWSDVRSQIGAYRNLESAKKLATNGYKVFNSKGEVIYTSAEPAAQPAVTYNPHLKDLQAAFNHDYGFNIYEDGIRGRQVEMMLNTICLKRGSKGQCVGWLQCRTGSNIDDDFGPNTEAAVRNFQRQHGLVEDGIAGKNTFNKLLEIYR